MTTETETLPRAPRQRRWVKRGVFAVLAALYIAALFAFLQLRNTENQFDENVTTNDQVVPVLTPTVADRSQPITFLLIGSDSREGLDSLENFGPSGGERADVIILLRIVPDDGTAQMLSIPRDTYVEIPGHSKNKINSAFAFGGAPLMVETVADFTGVPINHYVEVDFVGFKDIIDEIGGVELCVGNAARDTHSGLKLDVGCQTLDGVMALAYARSRYYEEWDGSQWVVDPRADLGRIERQQLFMRAAVDGALRELQSSPFGSGDLVESVAESVRIDGRLDPFDAAETLRAAVQEGMRTYRIPVNPTTISGNSVVELDGGSQQVLDYFRGVGPAPTEYETT